MRKLLIVMVAMSLTGCGSSRQNTAPNTTPTPATAAVLLQAGRDAMDGLTSVHILGTLTSGKKTYALDLSVSTSGDCIGSAGTNGGKMRIIGTASDIYVNADRPTWVQAGLPDVLATRYAGRWVTGNPGADGSAFRNLCSLGLELKSVFAALSHGSEQRLIGFSNVSGTRAVLVQTSDATGAWTVAVAANVPNYILRVSQPGRVAFTFDRFDVRVAPQIPSGAITIRPRV